MRERMSMEDQEAIGRMQRGDIGGLEPLVQRYQHRAVRAAYLITRDRDLAEDVVQAAFIRSFERIDQLRTHRAFESWFLRSVVNDATKSVIAAKRHVSIDAEYRAGVMVESLEDPSLSPEEVLVGIETREQLWTALGNLPSPQRATVVLRYYLGLSESDLADQLGSPRGTVKWRLHAARHSLRRMLSSQRQEVPPNGQGSE